MPARIDVRGVGVCVCIDVEVGIDVRASVLIGGHACVVHRHELLRGHELRLQRLLQVLYGRLDELEPRRTDAAFVGGNRRSRCGTEKDGDDSEGDG
jgi:hypothetical protein